MAAVNRGWSILLVDNFAGDAAIATDEVHLWKHDGAVIPGYVADRNRRRWCRDRWEID